MMTSSSSSSSRALFFVREAWKNVMTAKVLTLVAVLTIAVSLILVGLFGFVMVNASRLLDDIASDLNVTVYLADDVDNATIKTLLDNIAGRDEVETVRFMTREEDRARNLALITPELLEGLDAEAIPGQPSIEIQLQPRQRHRDDFDKLSAWLGELQGVAGVEELHYGAEKIRIIFAVIDLIRLTGLIICLIVLAAAVFFTFSTIKLAVYARQQEIEVLRLVGATDGYIRAPFYLEGAFAGLFGSATALLIVALIHGKLATFVEEEHLLNLQLDLMPAGMVAWLLLGGVCLGLAGSALSVGRYLRG